MRCELNIVDARDRVIVVLDPLSVDIFTCKVVNLDHLKPPSYRRGFSIGSNRPSGSFRYLSHWQNELWMRTVVSNGDELRTHNRPISCNLASLLQSWTVKHGIRLRFSVADLRLRPYLYWKANGWQCSAQYIVLQGTNLNLRTLWVMSEQKPLSEVRGIHVG